MPDGRGGRGWQGQEGQMAVVGGSGARGPDGSCRGSGSGGPDGRVVAQEADGREPDGVGTVGQGGPNGQEGGDGRLHEGQMAVAGGCGGGMGQEFKMVGRQGPDQGVRAVRGQIGAAMAR